MTLFDYDTKIASRDELQEKMNSADFWNDQESAHKTIGKYKLLKAQTDGLASVIDAFDNANIAYELAREDNDQELLTEADEQRFGIEKKMEQVVILSLLSAALMAKPILQ